MGKRIVSDKFALADTLALIGDGVRRMHGPVAYVTLLKLTELGFLKYDRDPTTARTDPKAPKLFTPTGKARGYLAISRKWKRPVAQA